MMVKIKWEIDTTNHKNKNKWYIKINYLLNHTWINIIINLIIPETPEEYLKIPPLQFPPIVSLERSDSLQDNFADPSWKHSKLA